VPTVSHDPRREVEKLREHLAAHDKPIAFLLGAGTSCSVRDEAGQPLVPAIAALTEQCCKAVHGLGKDFETAYGAIEAEVKQKGSLNIEEILSSVRRKKAAIGGGDKLAGLDYEGLETVERTIQATIATAATPASDRVPAALPHHALARWVKRTDRSSPVEIFTTNYDTLVERGLEDERVPAFDGFVGSRRPFFSPASLLHEEMAPGRKWARLWKIHGSVNWSWDELPDGSSRIVRGEETAAGELIFPSSEKYDESRKQPYAAILDRLHRVLTVRDDTVLVTVGYSFGDQHINEVIFDALEARDRLHAFVLTFSELPDEHELMRRARARSNLLVYGPGGAVVGGLQAPWELLEPVDDRTAALLDIPFDSHGEPEPGKTSLTGKFRLGDFKWFCAFLEAIAGTNA
jgi:hypothetical protein